MTTESQDLGLTSHPKDRPLLASGSPVYSPVSINFELKKHANVNICMLNLYYYIDYIFAF